MEEEVCQVLDAGVGVLQAQSHSGNVALHLHHVVHDQVGQNHQAVFSHPCIAHPQQFFRKTLFQLACRTLLPEVLQMIQGEQQLSCYTGSLSVKMKARRLC